MVAFEPAAEAMLDQPGRAVGAFEFEAAIPADGDRRIAAAVQKQQRLLTALQSLGHRLDQHRRQPLAALGRAHAHIDGGDGWKARRLVALLELDVAVAALSGIHQALDGGRGRAQHYGESPKRSAHHRHVARLIGDALLLLVAGVVLLIDDDEAEIGEGKEQRRAGADHELRLIFGNRPPHPSAHRRGKPRMPLRRLGAKPLLAAGDEMTGERDFRHQHQRLFAFGERRGDRLEIDLGLARAGDAVEQGHAEAVAHIGEHLACGRCLLRREPRPRRGEVELRRRPGGKLLGDEGAGVDQPVDHARADAGGLGERRLHPGHPVRRHLQHAGAGRRHARRCSAIEAHAVMQCGRREGTAGAHHHAQHHAWRSQRVSRHPIGEVERHARQRRHVVDDLDDLPQLLGV